MNPLYYLGRGLITVCFYLFGRWEVLGKEAIPPRGRLLIVANHLSAADPPAVAAAITRQTWFLAKRELFRGPLVSAVLRAWGVHPLSRDGSNTAALRWVLDMLSQERPVAIFPEGTRNPGGMGKANRGVAYIALKSQASILPIAITGTENVAAMWRIPFPFCRIRVNIGEPFSLPPVDGKVTQDVLDAMTEIIMLRIAALLPNEYRGVYS